MKILIVGAGVVGTVYGAHLAAAGHEVQVLSHPPRTDDVARAGLTAHDVLDGSTTQASAPVLADVAGTEFDLVLVAVRGEQLGPAGAALTGLRGSPAVVFFSNNPAGRSAISDQVPGEIVLGFPGIGGVLTDGTAEYVRIKPQPTALQVGDDTRLTEFAQVLGERGFAVQRIADMDGWLVYHAAFVACIAAALYRCGTEPGRLAADRATVRLMCAAITESFAALRKAGVKGLPGNLATLHSPLMRPVAVSYWTKTMKSPMGELYFAAHCRHAEAEMRALGDEVLSRLKDAARVSHLRELLTAVPVTAVPAEPAGH
jgi:2-dehydropantoate 2-reductase